MALLNLEIVLDHEFATSHAFGGIRFLRTQIWNKCELSNSMKNPGSFEPGFYLIIERCLCRIIYLCIDWRKLGLTAYISVVFQSEKWLRL